MLAVLPVGQAYPVLASKSTRKTAATGGSSDEELPGSSRCRERPRRRLAVDIVEEVAGNVQQRSVKRYNSLLSTKINWHTPADVRPKWLSRDIMSLTKRSS